VKSTRVYCDGNCLFRPVADFSFALFRAPGAYGRNAVIRCDGKLKSVQNFQRTSGPPPPGGCFAVGKSPNMITTHTRMCICI